MTKSHYPECWAKFPSDPEAWCICEELRFCEDRVSAAAVQRVEALLFPWPNTWPGMIRRGEALSAINALREEKE